MCHTVKYIEVDLTYIRFLFIIWVWNAQECDTYGCKYHECVQRAHTLPPVCPNLQSKYSGRVDGHICECKPVLPILPYPLDNDQRTEYSVFVNEILIWSKNENRRTVFNRKILKHTLAHTNAMKDIKDWQAVKENIVLFYKKILTQAIVLSV